ncbi:dystroglycan 1 [Cylas formicarius]|uniref:dystroglycan 1 n=1 Tax=Cylas formicarius TaxID=197179 RepID=UPI002958AB93|nr:dystroglycan 1 [Cylas formicarius]XP_060527790.1 dystroglycan 1 [Cylas formicarius]
MFAGISNPSCTVILLLTIISSIDEVTCEDGFTFDFPENVAAGITDISREIWAPGEVTALVGKLFHFVLPRNCNGTHAQGFEVKALTGKYLPSWLHFDAKSGVFFGIPLTKDIKTLRLAIKQLPQKLLCQELVISIVKNERQLDTCSSNEDVTSLTILLDKDLNAIKPKQRVAAVNNIAKFFGLPIGAFTLDEQHEKDDITESSIILAGPGNVQSRSTKINSIIRVQVGCDGRLWESVIPLVHNLKQQAIDGTLSEVLALPVIGWRIRTVAPFNSRIRRDTIDDYGSGDYDADYYDDDYDDENEDDVESVKPSKFTTSPTITERITTLAITTTHPHRHHHGEIKPDDEFSNISVIQSHPLSSSSKDSFQEELPSTLPTSTSSTSIPSTPMSEKTKIPKPDEALEYDDSDYDWAYDSEDNDDDPAESETTIPKLESKITVSNLPEETSPFTEISATSTTKPTTLEFKEEIVNETVEKANLTTPVLVFLQTTPANEKRYSTSFEIIDETEPPIIFTETTTSNPTTIITSSETIIPYISSSNAATTTTTSTTTTTTRSTTVHSVENATEILGSSTDYTTTLYEPTVKSTTTRQVSSTSIPKWTTELYVTEVIEPANKIPARNYRPYIENRLQYLSVTAGKIFRFVIPKNTFKDAEDGYNLTLQVLDGKEQPLPTNAWIQFNPLRKELYGLPLAEDVSNWVYVVRASDKEGDNEQDQLTIQVQQHKLERVVNHEFSMILRIEKPQEFPHYVDWSLKVLRALGRIYATNMSEITVRHINFTNDLVTFTWSNDSLSTNHCPRHEIEELYKMLTANDRGDPSRELSLILAPSLRVKKVTYHELSICRQSPPPVTPSTNFSPILRNPVDKVNATLGELLVFKVKDDTFYDPEDVDPSMLNITLLSSDLQAIPPTNWLQFDSKNREFYGIPRKIGRTEYWLVCVDSGGMSARDGLEVIVNPAAKRHYNVEFSMTIDVPFDTFSYNAGMQKKFVEKLMELFEEPSANNFHFLPFKQKRDPSFDSTVVLWFNKSLPVEKCPTDEIKRLEYILHNSDQKSISNRVHRIMSPDFTISTIKVHHIGNCKVKPQLIPTVAPTFTIPMKYPEEVTPPSAQNEVMITFIIPAIIIAIMLFMAAFAACVLYRRRRRGKMNVEENGTSSYGNRGIPVIFQEELDEKPESGTKTPVILKDEKPPLAPPEYSKSGSVKLDDSEPYQPPPPFTRTQEGAKQGRPKPTPTYRKPPPYVPP